MDGDKGVNGAQGKAVSPEFIDNYEWFEFVEFIRLSS